MRRIRRIFIRIVILYAVFEGLCLTGLFLTEHISGFRFEDLKLQATTFITTNHRRIFGNFIKEDAYLMHDSLLGWTIGENQATKLYRSNSQGIRADRDYALTPSGGKVRIAAFGASFVHGSSVKNDETWEYYLEQLDPRLEVINFGVEAYGVDQALLKYERLENSFPADITLIGFFSHDIGRHVNRLRAFYSPHTSEPFGKPRFVLEDDQLKLLKNPLPTKDAYQDLLDLPDNILPRIGESDFHFQNYPHHGPLDRLPSVRIYKIAKEHLRKSTAKDRIWIDLGYNPDSEAFKITVKIFERFFEDVQSNGSKPVVILFPARKDIVQYQNSGKKVYQRLIDEFTKRDMKYIDTLEAFHPGENFADIEELYATHHFSPKANKIVAAYIHQQLDHHNPRG